MTEQTRDLKATTRFDPGPVESHWMARWLDAHLFHAEPDPSRPAYSIVIPPPNITGNLHMGHALNGAVQDVLTRYHRMLGDNACWLLGTDHASIATQNVVEKQLRAQGRSKEDVGREEFVRLVWAWREQYGSTIVGQLKRLGCACDYERERFTLDQQYVRAVVKVFVALHAKGYIYKDHYIVNWCPRCGTAISDLEVEHVEETGHLYHVRYALQGGGAITIATTRPETMLGDTAVAVNPADERYRDVVGATALLPLVGRELPIVADERVDPQFGTGALKITPAHDLTDFDIGRDHGLTTIQAIGPDGRITEQGGPYAGLGVDEARERVVADLRAADVLEKVEDYTHSVATCQRCHTHIEPLISLQWFMRMDELKAPATEAVRDGRVRFVPERWGRVYIDWMDKLRPWCISRQLWWGHQLPVWYCEAEGCSETIVAEDEPRSCPKCGGTCLRRETDVLDTWFSSALWPFATWGWPDDTADLGYFYPTNLLSTAREIIFLWVARMVMMGLEFAGDVPFREVYIHSVIQAPDGRRMSKSLGTGIDPLEMIDKYGADATRFGLLLMSSSQDVRFSEEKIAMGRNFANKLWNAGRLVLLAADGAPPARSDADVVDRWITSRLARATAAVREALAGCNFSVAVDELYHFVWDEVCDWYLELVKGRLYSDDSATRAAAAGHAMFVLDGVVRLAHPFLPFVTEEIAAHYGAAPLLERAYAVAGPDDLRPADEAALTQVQSAIQALRVYRAEQHLTPATILSAAFVADDGPDGAAAGPLYLSFTTAFRTLSRVEIAARPAGHDGETAVLVPGGRFEVATPTVDRGEEVSRLRAQVDKLDGEVRRSQDKLANSGFVEHAPQAVIAKERAKLAARIAERDELAARLRSLS